MVREGRHPLQSKTVTIHSLKSLTAQHQPKDDDRSSSLLLHEFAHAVHDQLLGFDNAGIRVAYEQAMERQLYDKDSYAATNAREFFAELSCAYLDRLRYYPHTRADLKKHDPVTYKMMETVWSGAASKGAKAAPQSEKADLNVTFPKDVKLGKVLSGPAVDPAQLAGKVVLVGYWGGEFTNVLNKLEGLRDELGDYGLVVIAAHAYRQPDEAIKAKAEERAPRVTGLQNAFVRVEGGGPMMKSQPGGQALVFDSGGKCVYRGSAYDADDAVRAAVGKLLLTSALGSEEVPRAFKPVADAFAAGASPLAALPKVAPLKSASDEGTKTAAKKLFDAILAPGQAVLTGAEASAKSDPVAAFLAAEQVAAKFKNTPLAPKAATLVANLKVNSAVATELKARALANQVDQIGKKLRGQEGSFQPGDSAFQAKNKAALDQLRTVLEQLRKQYPSSHARAGAEKVAREFEIP